MAKSIDYHDYLIETLKEPSEATGYLNAALDDGDIDGFLEALRNVVEASGYKIYFTLDYCTLDRN